MALASGIFSADSIPPVKLMTSILPRLIQRRRNLLLSLEDPGTSLEPTGLQLRSQVEQVGWVSYGGKPFSSKASVSHL